MKYETRREREYLVAITDARNYELNLSNENRDIQILLISTLCQEVGYVLGSGERTKFKNYLSIKES